LALPSDSISSSCIARIGSLALSPPGTACFNGAGLIPFATLSPSASLIPPINTWLTGLCADAGNNATANQCNATTIGALVTNITSACEADLKNLGLSASTLEELPGLFEAFYKVGLQAACTK
jgi:hypothetical protein